MSNNNADWGADTSAQAGPGPAEGAQHETGEPNVLAVVEALNAENSQLKDRVLRTLAEMENLRRRTEREVSDAKTYGVNGFARDMLTVVDNLSRALEHLPAEARDERRARGALVDRGRRIDRPGSGSRRSVATGSRSSTRRARSSTPIFTRRSSRRRTRRVPSGTVSQVVQSGWTIGDRVLRPAMVGVSKGGPKAAPKQEQASGRE